VGVLGATESQPELIALAVNPEIGVFALTEIDAGLAFNPKNDKALGVTVIICATVSTTLIV